MSLRISQAAHLVSLIAALLVAGACGAADGADNDTDEDTPVSLHLMLTGGGEAGSGAPAPAGGTARLEYYGGPVLASAAIHPVYWGPKVAHSNELDSFYSKVPRSAHFDWLREYDVPGHAIGHGHLAASVHDDPRSTPSVLTDAKIRTELRRLQDAGKLPNDDPNALFMVHLPPGVTVDLKGERSCERFCAYHGAFKRGARAVYYGVIPDMSGRCAAGCGAGSDLDRVTTVASHEMVEAVTDPAVGLAKGLRAPLAWYDGTRGEIGDICVGRSGRVDGFAVQAEWSNAARACVVTRGPGKP